jgi:hypothetical protein
MPKNATTTVAATQIDPMMIFLFVNLCSSNDAPDRH